MVKNIYEYVIVNADWFGGNLDKGTRLYYDYSTNSYCYHYENNQTYSNDKYKSVSSEVIDYSISLDVATKNIHRELLIPGPELGALESACTNCDCKSVEPNGL